MSRAVCLELNSVCASILIHKIPGKKSSKIVLGVNDVRKEKNLKSAFGNVVNPTYHNNLLDKYLNKFQTNYLDSDKHQFTINGYLGVEDFDTLIYSLNSWTMNPLKITMETRNNSSDSDGWQSSKSQKKREKKIERKEILRNKKPMHVVNIAKDTFL